MLSRARSQAILLATLGTVLAGCEQATGPGDPMTVDAEGILADYQALDSVLSSQSMAGFKAMASGITFQSLGPEGAFIRASVEALHGAAAGGAELLGSRAGAKTWAGGIGQLVHAMGPEVAKVPLISSLRRGKTFVYDPDLGRYVMDPDREGAPPTGVRFILYAPAGGRPDVTQEVGYADLTDEGDGIPKGVALRLTVVEGERAVLDYRTTIDVLARGGKVGVEGFIQGPYDRLTFTLGVDGTVGSEGSEVDIAFQMALANRGFQATGSLHGVNGVSGEGGQLNLVVTHRLHTFAVDLTGTDSTIGGTVELNGRPFATVSGHPDDPVVTGPGGEPLKPLEILALLRIVNVSGGVFALFGILMDPLDELLLLALIL